MCVLKYSAYVFTDDDPLISINTELPFPGFVHISLTSYVRLMSCVYLEKNRKLFSHIARSPVELHEMFITCGSKLNDDLKSSTQWLSYDVLNCDMTDLNQWLKLTQC